jgi:hypothetical protein
MLRVSVADELLRIGEVLSLPFELAVACVPSRRAELGAEIDQRVARQLLFAERARDPVDLIGSGERPVRLHVSERPKRRKFGKTRDPRVL